MSVKSPPPSTTTPPPGDHWSEELSRALTEERHRAQKLVGPLRERLDTLEAALARQVEHLVEQLVARQRRQYEIDLEELAHQRCRLDARREQLDRLAEELEARDTETRLQRRRIAEQLRAQRRELSSGSGRGSGVAGGEAAVWHERLAAAEEQLEQLRRDRDELARRLSAAEEPAAGAGAMHAEPQEAADLRRRLELAMSDLRELRKRNAELESQAAAPPRPAAAIDWETRKRQLLAQLEAEEDTSDPQRQEERLTIDGVIRLTDAVVQDKDREIAELKRLLDEQSQNVGSMAVGAAALGDMLDRDEIIQHERQRLQQLQAEWEEKLRAAEIDLSVERAKIARERAEIEERKRAWEAEQARLARSAAPDDPGSAGASSARPARGRWLAHLGLKKKPDDA